MSKFIILQNKEEFNYENYISNTEFVTDIPHVDCDLIVLRPTDDFDITIIEPWAVEYFEIRSANVLDIKEVVEAQTDLVIDYASDIPIDDIEIFSIVFPAFNELTDHTDKFSQPYNSWIWDKDANHWKPPLEKPNLDPVMDVRWFDEWMNWRISFGRSSATRKEKAFQLWLAAEADGSSMFMDACSTRDYMIKPFENTTHNTRNIETLIKNYNDSIAQNSESVRPYMSIQGHLVVIDLSPIALITYSECHNDAINMFEELYSMHPQFFARTPQELFRLIIEWAYSHTDLQNNELTATTCHNILKAVQMPKNIRDGLIAMASQQVGKFLEGNLNALVEDAEDPEPPVGFNQWVNTLYYHYPHLETGQEPHIDTLPEAYPV